MRSAEYSQLASLKWTVAMLAATFTVGGMYLIEQGRMTEVVFYATGIANVAFGLFALIKGLELEDVLTPTTS